ncbi:MAG: hypothetical protein RL023_527 [Candidatus Parcubacteria bacterium]|jgi:hypothetical protein
MPFEGDLRFHDTPGDPSDAPRITLWDTTKDLQSHRFDALQDGPIEKQQFVTDPDVQTGDGNPILQFATTKTLNYSIKNEKGILSVPTKITMLTKVEYIQAGAKKGTEIKSEFGVDSKNHLVCSGLPGIPKLDL